MSVPLPLDSRQESIARALIAAIRPVSTESVARELDLTDRVVRYNLPPVIAFLAAHGVTVRRRPGLGAWTEGGEAARSRALVALDSTPGLHVFDAAERQVRITLALLRAAPDALASESFEATLQVSRPTIRRDVREVGSWLDAHRLHLRRLPGVGIRAVGGELEIRAGLLTAIAEAVPQELLAWACGAAGASGPRAGRERAVADLLVDLDLARCRAVLRDVFPALPDTDPATISGSLLLAIVVRRFRDGRPARLGSGRLRSLLDHPASGDAARIGERLVPLVAVLGQAPPASQGLPPTEVAAITEGLLALKLIGDAAEGEIAATRLADRILLAAAKRLHPALATDEQLRARLVEHLGRLGVRIRYGLPLANPLAAEVRQRYPEVDAVVGELVADLSRRGSSLPADEATYLTMYLAGSLERLRLRPKVRVTVVCPAGMATAWILVSRLVAEFPHVEVVGVVSRADLGSAAVEATDLVISTIPLEEASAKTVVVGPLLRDGDVRRLARAIGSLPA